MRTLAFLLVAVFCLPSIGCWKLLPELKNPASGSSPTKEGETWTPGEMIDHLNKKGLKLKIQKSSEHIFTGDIECLITFDEISPASVNMTVYKSSERAKTQVSLIDKKRSFQWGKFGFDTSTRDIYLLDRIKAALGL